jgi:hypothetical protein
MRYILGIIVFSIDVLWDIIILFTQKNKSRKDIITYVFFIVCDVLLIIIFAMKIRFNSLA